MNNKKWLLQVCNKSVALDWTKILSYWLYTRSGMEHLKVKESINVTPCAEGHPTARQFSRYVYEPGNGTQQKNVSVWLVSEPAGLKINRELFFFSKWNSVCYKSYSLILESQVVTICTANLTFSNSTFCPHSVLMCFMWISEQTAIISLHSINWLVCITEI